MEWKQTDGQTNRRTNAIALPDSLGLMPLIDNNLRLPASTVKSCNAWIVAYVAAFRWIVVHYYHLQQKPLLFLRLDIHPHKNERRKHARWKVRHEYCNYMWKFSILQRGIFQHTRECRKSIYPNDHVKFHMVDNLTVRGHLYNLPECSTP